MTDQTSEDEATLLRIMGAVRRYWGYSSLRPLQKEAIRAGLDHRDSLVVMPTGGGKSLCYQVPALLDERTDLVVSPLISLMKDQVDGLQACGYPAAALHSGMSPDERHSVRNDLVAGKYRLVFVAPERLVNDGFLSMMSRLNVRSVAIDEAHCISHWGHDFRPEYRRLSELKERLGGASLHAYTATATERVRADIINQLELDDPAVLVGCFDRPNLNYRIIPRVDLYAQVMEVLGRHKGEATIIYCISRKDTEALAGFLKSRGVNAAHYHAGMNPDDRRLTQESFTNETTDVIVATVAFGMGIDRSNVRSVIHAALPKSIEHYQQETGRAGRDGLEAECVLFYSYSDVARWRSLLTRSAEEAECSQEIIDAQMALLEHLRRYCQPFHCRHKHLSEYFGQSYDKDDCRACDVCLGEGEKMEDASVAAQKILSCVARAEERFGVHHIVDILHGGDTEMVRKWNHQSLSTYGLMKETSRKRLVSMLHELLDQGLMDRTTDKFQTLRLNAASWEVMGGDRKVNMRKAAEAPTARSRGEEAGWDGVDRGLFESLRGLRKEIAAERGVPPFVVFSDATLRDMTRKQPRTAQAFLTVQGVGEKKLADFGDRFLACLAESSVRRPPLDGAGYVSIRPSPTPGRDGAPAREPPAEPGAEGVARRPPLGGIRCPREDSQPGPRRSPATPNKVTQLAIEMFSGGASVEEVMTSLGRARSTTMQYLARYVETARPKSVRHWVDDETYAKVVEAAGQFGSKRLKPIFELLDGKVPYDVIRIVTAHLQAGDETEGGG